MPHPIQFIIGWKPPGPALLWGSVGFKGTWKRKACSLYQRIPPLPTVLSASSLSHLEEQVTPLFSINYPTSLHPHALFEVFYLEYKNQDLLTTDYTSTINICGKQTRRNWWDPNMLSLPIFILIHLSLSSGTMPHHLMLQKQAPLTAWVVGDPYAGAFTWCLGLIWSLGLDRLHPDWQDATFVSWTHELLQAHQGTGFMFVFPGPAPGDESH
jgi:hypothetical protein